MNAKLPDHIIHELERAGDARVRVENPRDHKIYVLVPEEEFAQGERPKGQSPDGDEWSEEKNARRFLLIKRDIAGTITAEETLELQRLQSEIDAYLRRVAPLPLKQLEDLHSRVLQQAKDFRSDS